jgi:hypothetical protein
VATWYSARQASAFLVVLLCGCGQPPPDRSNENIPQDRRQVEGIDISVRLEVAETRITKLERRIIELKAAPSIVEAELLKQRLITTEAALREAASSTGIKSEETSQEQGLTKDLDFN